MRRSRHEVTVSFSALLLLVCACNSQMLGGDGSAGDMGPGNLPPIAGMRGIDVSPAAATLTADTSGPPRTQQFRAVGHFDAAPDQDVSDRVAWRIDNPALGA